MKDDKENLDKLAIDIADGKNIDWKKSKQSNTENKGVLEQLNVIAEISKAYGQQFNDTDTQSKINNQNILFDWGHLQVLEKIGEGSYGEVYRAYDSILDREVALKLLKQEKLTPIQSRAFIQEARRLAKVRNRNVLAIHGANIHSSRVGMWSDLISGSNLTEQKEKHNYQSNELIQVTLSLADALIAVHNAGLIHGDIKPSNVMIDVNNKLTLMDFGAGIESNHENKQTGYIIGTLLYMAPELFEKNTLNSASDIYALGVLLFYLATHQYPIKGKNLADIKQSHLNKNYISLDQLRPDLPKKLRVLIQQMLVSDPSQRPTATKIKHQLNWIITAPLRRNKRIAISMIISLLIIGTLVSSLGFFRANQAQHIAIQEKKKAEKISEFMKDTLKAPASLGKGKDVRVADLLATAAQQAEEKFADQPHSMAAVLYAIGDSYNSLKLPEDALNHLSKSLLIQQTTYGEKSPELLDVLLEVAESQHVVGNDPEAKKLYFQAIEIAKSQGISEKHIFAQIKLADLIRIEGNYSESQTMLKKIIPQIPEENHKSPNKFLALLVLAQNYLRLSKYPLSESTAKGALQWLKQYQPNDDIHRNEVLNIIARTLIWQRKLPEAETISRELVDLVQILYGNKNYEYLRANTLLSTTLFEQGKYTQAMELQEHLLSHSSQVQGNKKFYAVIISTNLANTKVKINDASGAEQLMHDALTLAYSFLEEDNVQVLSLELNLVGLLNIVGRFKEAEELAQKTHKKIKQKLGDQHMFTYLILDELAVSFAGQQKFVEAQTLHQKIIDELTHTNEGQTSQMIIVLGHYVTTLEKSGQKNKAIENLKQLIPLQEKILGKDHPETQISKKQLVMLQK